MALAWSPEKKDIIHGKIYTPQKTVTPCSRKQLTGIWDIQWIWNVISNIYIQLLLLPLHFNSFKNQIPGILRVISSQDLFSSSKSFHREIQKEVVRGKFQCIWDITPAILWVTVSWKQFHPLWKGTRLNACNPLALQRTEARKSEKNWKDATQFAQEGRHTKPHTSARSQSQRSAFAHTSLALYFIRLQIPKQDNTSIFNFIVAKFGLWL